MTVATHPAQTRERLPPRHDWVNGTTRWRAHTEFPDGCARTERTCARCGLVKITVNPSAPGTMPWREWRTRNGMMAQMVATPPCLVEVET